jgi:hypothetical protein
VTWSRSLQALLFPSVPLKSASSRPVDAYVYRVVLRWKVKQREDCAMAQEQIHGYVHPDDWMESSGWLSSAHILVRMVVVCVV